MSKFTCFDLRPCMFKSRDEVKTSSDPMLNSWNLKYDFDKKYGIVPISEAIPFEIANAAEGAFETDFRTSDHVRIVKVCLSLYADWKPGFRFFCQVYRHPERHGESLSLLTRPHVDSVKQLELGWSRQPVGAILFDMLDAGQVSQDFGRFAANAGSALECLPEGLGLVSAKTDEIGFGLVGNKFDVALDPPQIKRGISLQVKIDLDEVVHYTSLFSSTSVDGRPLELFIGIDSEFSEYRLVPNIELPIIVTVFYENI